jgi:hypothetical protein
VELLFRSSQLARPLVPISGTRDRPTYLALGTHLQGAGVQINVNASTEFRQLCDDPVTESSQSESGLLH